MSGIVLVTGASGFIGRHVCRRLREEGFAVYVPNRPEPVDYVVNLGAPTGMAETRENPDVTIETATRATVQALEVARRWPVKRFVHAATEEQYRTPVQPYGAAKRAQQAAVEAYRDTYGVPTVILSADLVFGPGQPSSKFVPAVAAALRSGRPVDIAVDPRTGDGVVRSYAYVDDYVDRVLMALTVNAWSPEVDVPGWRMSTEDMACAVGEAIGLRVAETSRRAVITTGRPWYPPLPARVLRAALLESLA